MRQLSVLVCRFPGGNAEHPDTTDWMIQTIIKMKSDHRISTINNFRIADTPITMGRNRAMEVAKESKSDLILMIDSDMKPDMYLGKCPNAVPFWDVAFNFLWKHSGPAMIGAPYCGPPPEENVYVFQWATQASDHPNTDHRLAQFTREETVGKSGIEQVAALPTGLVLIDARAAEYLKPPYFYYEWKDKREQEKASTEDVTFTRDLSIIGVPLYVLWDAWAGHWKPKCVGRPGYLTPDSVGERMRELILRDKPVVIAGQSWEDMNLMRPYGLAAGNAIAPPLVSGPV